MRGLSRPLLQRIVVAALLMLSTPLLHAQLRFGISANPGMGGIRSGNEVQTLFLYTDADYNKVIKQPAGFSFNAGMFALYKMNHLFSLSLGANYMTYGNEISIYDKNTDKSTKAYVEHDTKVNYKISSVYLPLQVKFIKSKKYVPGQKETVRAKPFVSVGGFGEYRLSKKFSATDQTSTYNVTTGLTKFPVEKFPGGNLDGMPSFTYGFTGSAGLHILSGESALEIGIAYYTTLGNDKLYADPASMTSGLPDNLEIYEKNYQETQGRLWGLKFNDWRNYAITGYLAFIF